MEGCKVVLGEKEVMVVVVVVGVLVGKAREQPSSPRPNKAFKFLPFNYLCCVCLVEILFRRG